VPRGSACVGTPGSHTMRALAQAPWQDPVDPLEGVVLHEPMPDAVRAAELQAAELQTEDSDERS
jgi:hypothetical protein